jgi:Flp pilus assembly protein TadD
MLSLSAAGCARDAAQAAPRRGPFSNPIIDAARAMPATPDGPNPDETAASAKLSEALQHYRDGDTAQALSTVRQARELDPSLKSAWELEAALTGDLGDTHRHAEALYAVLAAHPDSASIQSTAGQTLVHAGFPQLGLAAMERAVRLDPRHTEYARDLASAYLHLGDAHSAVRVLTDAHRNNPSDHALALALARVHESAGQWEEALRHYTLALQGSPQNAAWRRQRARCLYRTGDYARAAEEFNTCLETDVKALTTADRIEFGDACLRTGDVERAAWLFAELSRSGVLTKEVELLRGICALRLGQPAEAEQVLTAAVQRWPDDPTLARLAEASRTSAGGAGGVVPASGTKPSTGRPF